MTAGKAAQRDRARIAAALENLEEQRFALWQAWWDLRDVVSNEGVGPTVYGQWSKFQRSGGVTPQDWDAWLRGDIEQDKVTERNGLRLVVENPEPQHQATRRRRHRSG